MSRVSIARQPNGAIHLVLDDGAQRLIDAAREAGVPTLRVTNAPGVGGGRRPTAPLHILTGAPRFPLRGR